MAIQTITNTPANSGLGDSLSASWTKANANFSELDARNPNAIDNYEAAGDGTTDDYAEIVAGLADGSTLRLTPGTYYIGTNLTVSESKTIIFERGAKLKPASGVKIILNCEVVAGRYQIFDYSASGKCCFGFYARTAELFPEWWGGLNDGTTDNATAFGRIYDTSLDATENSQPLILNHGYYLFNSGITLRSKSIVRGVPGRKTRFHFAPSASGNLITLADGADNIELSGIQFHVPSYTAGVRTTAIGASTTGSVSTVLLSDCVFTAFNKYAVDLRNVVYFECQSCEFSSVTNQTSIGGTGDGSAICLNFRGYANAVVIDQETHAVNCEAFLKTESSASLNISNSSFEQDAAGGALIDAITNKGNYIDFVGSNLRVTGNYFEGIRTDTNNAIVYVASTYNYAVRDNYMTGMRPGGSSVVYAYVRANLGCHGGIVSGNTFYGTCTHFVLNNGANGPCVQVQNTYRETDGTVRTTLASFRNKASSLASDIQSEDFCYFSRPIQIRALTQPAAPPAGEAAIWVDGSGAKAVLKVRFATGASQTIATEP